MAFGRAGSRWMERHPWSMAPFGGFLLLAGLGTAATAAGPWLDRAEYAAAPSCDDARTDDCVDGTAVVVRRWVRRRRSDGYYVELDPVRPDLPAQTVELSAPDRVFGALTSSRAVAVRLWNGRVARVDVPGVGRSETEDSPVIRSVSRTVVGASLAGVGALVLWAWRDAAGRAARRTGRVVLAWTAGWGTALLVMSWFDVYDARLAPVTAVTAGAVLVWPRPRRG